MLDDLVRAFANQFDQGACERRAFIVAHSSANRRESPRNLGHRRRTERQNESDNHQGTTKFEECSHCGRTSIVSLAGFCRQELSKPYLQCPFDSQSASFRCLSGEIASNRNHLPPGRRETVTRLNGAILSQRVQPCQARFQLLGPFLRRLLAC